MATYTVQKGDTLWKIANDNDTTVARLVKLNNIKNPDLIVVGQVINLDARKVTTLAIGNKAIIDVFGLQSNTDRTLYATWSWDEKNTKEYKLKWEYDTGDSVWFIGNDSTTEDKQCTYNAPSNAKRVRFKVQPVAKTRKVNDKDAAYWSAKWSDVKTFSFGVDDDPKTPSAPSIGIDGYKLTLELSGLDDLKADHIRFHVVKVTDKGTSNVVSTLVPIVAGRASYSGTATAGNTYAARCRAYRKSGNRYSEWSPYSNHVETPPATPQAIKICRANSKTSIYLEWDAIPTATRYDIEYTTKVDYFDKTSETTTVSDIELTRFELTGLTMGEEYFFRLRAKNNSGESGWSGVTSTSLGTPPAAPTTWSSTTTAIAGEPLNLYWVHNSEDGSSQTFAELEIEIGGEKETHTIKNSTDEDEKDKTSVYAVDTSDFQEGAQIKWRVRTAGVTNEYGDWSIHRTVDIYAPPTVELSVTTSTGSLVDDLKAFPFYISALAGPNTQAPIGYHLTITADEGYETVDNMGNAKLVSPGDEVYSKYFDVTGQLLVELSANNVDLENDISYTVTCIVSMNSGLTAEATAGFTARWAETFYSPNAEISIDTDIYSASIRPYCEERRVVCYKLNQLVWPFEVTSEEIDESLIEDLYTDTDDEVRCGIDGDTWRYYCVSYSDNSEGSTDIHYYWADLVSGTFVNTGVQIDDISNHVALTDTGEAVLIGRFEGTTVYYCSVQENRPVPGVSLAVYRREFDGSFTELAKNLDNLSNTYITDPHPALDYARYRIVATEVATGAVSYYDVPGYPVGGKSVILQWDEEWSNFETSTEDALEQPPWSGSLLKLPYNIDVSDNNKSDVALVEYIGRSHPISYYGTQLGQAATWNVAVVKNDEETLYALRRLSRWMGDVYVREPSGSGYWANVAVSFSQKHRDLSVPVTLNITRVEGGV